MPPLVLATHNQGKLAELRTLLADLPLDLLSLDDFPGVPPVVEDGATFSANAIKKARQTAEFLDRWVLADDSGLEVRVLNGQPGVRSARYAGENADDDANNARLLADLAGIPTEERQARFVCVIAIASPLGQYWTVEGFCEGMILEKPRGSHGFGYDPLFWVPQLRKTFGEADAKEKASWSHRGQALRKMRRDLQKKINLIRKN